MVDIPPKLHLRLSCMHIKHCICQMLVNGLTQHKNHVNNYFITILTAFIFTFLKFKKLYIFSDENSMYIRHFWTILLLIHHFFGLFFSFYFARHRFCAQTWRLSKFFDILQTWMSKHQTPHFKNARQTLMLVIHAWEFESRVYRNFNFKFSTNIILLDRISFIKRRRTNWLKID